MIAAFTLRRRGPTGLAGEMLAVVSVRRRPEKEPSIPCSTSAPESNSRRRSPESRTVSSLLRNSSSSDLIYHMSKIEYLVGRRILTGIVPEGDSTIDYESATSTAQSDFVRESKFNTSTTESESIGPEDDVLLIGPVRTISGYGTFVIYVDLMDKDTDLPLLTDGLMAWNPNQRGNVYDQPTSDEVDGDYGDDYDSGSVIVNYIVLTHAVEATVTVTLLVEDGEDPFHVYGRITACNSTFSEGSLLFRKKSNEHIDVMPGQLIPLSRSVVAVPFDSILTVQADLRDYGAISSDVIAKGMAVFHPEFFGTADNSICGPGNKKKILVNVTWA
ncbi:hypothetical protein HHK36_018767 [Tetracentron sinense]|uniref:DUF6598 domain-containing protein n=1 Tax=Tetracentron sinense TaxID=13715 RepID=A0A835D9D8_TETSI|nr:hypothetical protein HHK36_018767 [Tetracentron sinense]